MIHWLTRNVRYIRYETMIRLSKGWMITTKMLGRKESLKILLVLLLFFLGKLFTSIFGGNQFMIPSYYVYGNDEGKTVAYALTALCLGISYSLILVVVWLASVNRSQELTMQLHALSGVQNNSSLEQTPQAIKRKLFLYYRWAFIAYLGVNAMSWLGINANLQLRVYHPYVKQMVDETIECIFISMILYIFRARNFNVIIINLNDAMHASLGEQQNSSQVVPVNDPQTIGDTDTPAVKESILIINPGDHSSLGQHSNAANA